MVENLFLPDMPTTPLQVNGVMPIEWQEFFRLLYNRVGGETTDLDLTELTDLVNSNFITLQEQIEDTYIEAEFLMNAISKGHF